MNIKKIETLISKPHKNENDSFFDFVFHVLLKTTKFSVCYILYGKVANWLHSHANYLYFAMKSLVCNVLIDVRVLAVSVKFSDQCRNTEEPRRSLFLTGLQTYTFLMPAIKTTRLAAFTTNFSTVSSWLLRF